MHLWSSLTAVDPSSSHRFPQLLHENRPRHTVSPTLFLPPSYLLFSGHVKKKKNQEVNPETEILTSFQAVQETKVCLKRLSAHIRRRRRPLLILRWWGNLQHKNLHHLCHGLVLNSGRYFGRLLFILYPQSRFCCCVTCISLSTEQPGRPSMDKLKQTEITEHVNMHLHSDTQIIKLVRVIHIVRHCHKNSRVP